MSTGQLGILNVGAGDTKISFDPSKPAEVERACAVVMDMIRRGYAIMVQVGERDGKPLYMRAESFDPATAEYIVVGLPETNVAAAEPKLRNPETNEPDDDDKAQEAEEASPPKRKGRGRRIAARSTHGVAVAPISGG
ncbi:MAG TPA: hypothetical protein VD932_03815 [Aquabacterium sp.]|nr:hypothetical protein [Aquabacterium sp.]